MKATKEGEQVMVIDDQSNGGGNCTHKGTIPSKALRHAIQQLSDTTRFVGGQNQELLKSGEPVIRQKVDLRQGFYDRNLVEVIRGRAVFVDEHTVEVKVSAEKKQYTADGFIIATGSRPYHPPDVDFPHPRTVDSDSILHLKENPPIDWSSNQQTWRYNC